MAIFNSKLLVYQRVAHLEAGSSTKTKPRVSPTTKSEGLSSGAPLISELGATLNLKPQAWGNDGSFD